jgi:hypothetical protein
MLNSLIEVGRLNMLQWSHSPDNRPPEHE